jgi:ribosomal protein S18 acetylase RimI-like enzyme
MKDKQAVHIRKATLDDLTAIAELAMMAGEGIPAYFWEASRQPGQDILAAGAALAASETDNFSYRNMHMAQLNGRVAGMLLAYRLPEAQNAEDLQALPGFIRPLVELEQCVPGSFYINMLATFPDYRNRGVGSALMGITDALAAASGCTLLSIEVFEQNRDAIRLYRKLGYNVAERRRVIPHPCHPYTGELVLLTRPVDAAGDDTA